MSESIRARMNMTRRFSDITSTAPGKLVLSGEYVVLLGAPAVVCALDFCVHCRLSAPPENTHGWHFQSLGFDGKSHHDLEELLGDKPPAVQDPARLCWYVTHALVETVLQGDSTSLPQNLDVKLDSRACYQRGQKLGVGSSAAICVALCGALLILTGHYSKAATYALAMQAHRAFQGGRGSGLDIAASVHGGCIEFSMPRAETKADLPLVKSLSLPDNGFKTLIWTGKSADKTTHITRFLNWYHSAQPPGARAAVERVMNAAENFVSALSRPESNAWMGPLNDYTTHLKYLDETLQLGIYRGGHRRLDEIATREGVLYKPCGAGGGDIGVAMSISADPLQHFSQAVVQEGFSLLPMEIEQHGLQTTAH